jgi:hypothetical protein
MEVLFIKRKYNPYNLIFNFFLPAIEAMLTIHPFSFNNNGINLEFMFIIPKRFTSKTAFVSEKSHSIKGIILVFFPGGVPIPIFIYKINQHYLLIHIKYQICF